MKVRTGAPGVKDKKDKQRCWTLTVGSESLRFVRSAQNGTCPGATEVVAPTNGAAGNITQYTMTKELPDNLLPNCKNTGVTNLLSTDYIGYGGPSTNDAYIWLTPSSFGISQNGEGGANPVLNLMCVSNALPKNEDESLWALTTYTSGCTLISMKPRAGAILAKSDTSCASSLPSDASPYPLNFINLPAGGGELTPPTSTVPTEIKEVPVVKYSFGLTPSGSSTVLDIVDPCTSTRIRAAIAASLPGSSVNGIVLTYVSDGNTRIDLTPSSPANSFTAVPGGCTSRRLLREDRMLQSSMTVGVQAAVPPSSNNFLSSVNSAQPSLPGYGIAAAQGATTSTAMLPVPKTFPARIRPYIPAEEIVMYHGIPRFVLVGEGAATNEFSTDYSYFEGALYPAGGLFALAILSLIIYAIAYTCGCCACTCCKCRRKRNRVEYNSGFKKFCSTPKAIVFFALINVALVLSIISYLGRFGRGVENFVQILDGFADLMGGVAGLLASPVPVKTAAGTYVTSIADSLEGAGLAANQSNTLCENNNPQCVPAITAILGAASGAGTMASSMARSLGPVLTNMTDFLTSTRDSIDIEGIKSQINMAGYIVLAFFAVTISAYSLMVCKSRCACITFRILVPFNILLVTIIIILAGAFYAIGIIGADICIDPQGLILGFAEDGNFTGMPFDTIRYYLTCGIDPTLPRIGALQLFDDNIGMVSGAVAQVKDLKDQIAADPNNAAWQPLAPPNALVGYVYGNLSNAETAVVELGTVQLGCQTIEPIFSDFFTFLCNDGFAVFIGISRIFIALSIMLVIQLGIGVDICCFHPGDPSRWLTDEEIAAQKAMDSTNSKPTAVHVVDEKFAGKNPMVGVPKVGHGTNV